MEGTVQGKVWGTTETVFKDKNTHIELIRVDKDGFCSLHRHNSKYNLFLVLSGRLKVTTHKDGLEDSVVLGPFQRTTIAPGHFHQFHALEEVVALEVYWTQLEDSDIERKNQGGKAVKEEAVRILDGLGKLEFPAAPLPYQITQQLTPYA
jgi:mannose-6-phosphate isomerase-like protein (cupin superfamily)